MKDLYKSLIVVLIIVVSSCGTPKEMIEIFDKQKEILAVQEKLTDKQEKFFKQVEEEVVLTRTNVLKSEDCGMPTSSIKRLLLNYKMGRKGNGNGTPVGEEQIVHVEPYLSYTRSNKPEYLVVTLEIEHQKINKKKKQISTTRIYHSQPKDTLFSLEDFEVKNPPKDTCWDWNLDITYKKLLPSTRKQFVDIKSDTLDYSSDRLNRIRKKDILDIKFKPRALGDYRICRVFVN